MTTSPGVGNEPEGGNYRGPMESPTMWWASDVGSGSLN